MAALTLRIENFTSLPDGGALSYTVTGARGFDIGRDSYLDWTLPDPTRYISSKHCEVRFQDGGYVLYDVSTNGTFLNNSDRRMHGPHPLSNGDRILIGNYIVVAEVDQADRLLHPPAPVPSPADGAGIWESEGAAPPASRSEIVPASSNRARQPDFLDWAVDIPVRADPPPQAEPRSIAEPPKRSIWVDSSPTGAWALSEPAPPRPPAPALLRSAGEESAHSPTPAPCQPPPSSPIPHGASAATAPTPGEAMVALARGAGVPVEAFTRRDSIKVLEEVGATLRIVAEHMMRLLSARSSVKRTIRSTEHTTIAAVDNNPFKFSPSVEDSLRIAFGPPTRSYLNGPTAFTRGFEDIGNHQLRVFTAMQQALAKLVEDLDPAVIDAACGAEKGVSALLSSRKSRLWDHYAATWRAKSQYSEEGIVGLFLHYFSECYDRLGERDRVQR
ncbi:type VI secretion system-associated FHA domain protein TagH [Xanthobacter oligotrophicus]|uniref:type VI secretion system-associated FHA domain protein TagH n=1 Tax=Xanthobacter oligotrophicus TaxID=2607286 RepID=UPI0011F1A522|nr:type VI secretion system-associated FHA domain protein TagH [Xanthobacter oligotrophicus]MCG5233952.1 type VI secretion system-associated FHA domain protein TagH [Xanthobacter oligotrophicus]